MKPFQRMPISALHSVERMLTLCPGPESLFKMISCLVSYRNQEIRFSNMESFSQGRNDKYLHFFWQNIMEVIHFQHPQTRDFKLRSSNSSKPFFLFCFFIFQQLAKTKLNHPDQPSLPSGAWTSVPRQVKCSNLLSADNSSSVH